MLENDAYDASVMEETCDHCLYWERHSRLKGRCWAPESNGESLGIEMIANGPAMLITGSGFGCSAFEEGSYDELE